MAPRIVLERDGRGLTRAASRLIRTKHSRHVVAKPDKGRLDGGQQVSLSPDISWRMGQDWGVTVYGSVG